MKVEIWSDVVCPWCYVGKRRLEDALSRFDHGDEVEVVWRSYELDPDGPPERTGAYVDRLARKYGATAAQAQAMVDRMTASAAADGLDFRFDKIRAGNTFDAHRLLHLAADRGVQGELKERLLRATFTDGEPIGDRDALVRLASDVGLDPAEARAVLDGDAYADAVRADEVRAARLAVTGVPFFVVGERYALSGAQDPDVILDVLEQAWAAQDPVVVVAPAGDGACEGDNCAV